MNPCPNCKSDRDHLEAACDACGWSPEPQRKDTQPRPKKVDQLKATPASRRSTLWWAFAVSPLVAPITFAICFFVLGMIALTWNPDQSGTPAGVIIVPLLACTGGVFLSYVAAGIAMPVIFYLENRKQLSAISISTTALFGLLGLVVLALIPSMIFGSPQNIGQAIGFSGGAFLILSPFVLTSALTFWWIQREGYRGMSFGAIMLTITALACFLALCSPILRVWFF